MHASLNFSDSFLENGVKTIRPPLSTTPYMKNREPLETSLQGFPKGRERASAKVLRDYVTRIWAHNFNQTPYDYTFI